MRTSFQVAFWAAMARKAAMVRPLFRQTPRFTGNSTGRTAAGISVVIPSRNGRALLALQLPGIVRELATFDAEIIVVDNGSDDGTAAWLAEQWPRIRVLVSTAPLSFARAVNRGIVEAQFRHVCLLNNDMLLDQGFFDALVKAFSNVPDLFCATAQIRFPAGVRREETGKAVMAQSQPEDFPLRCDDPLPGEDGTWVLYGSGGCSLYDLGMLRELGLVDTVYEPAYVEDLDLGYRAWQRDWPSVYVAGATVEHRHRATTSRYFTEDELEAVLEINYLRFLARAVAERALFRKLWDQAIARLVLRSARPPARQALRLAAGIVAAGCGAEAAAGQEERFLALTDGSVSVFPGAGAAGVLVSRVDQLAPPTPELLNGYAEVVVARGAAAFEAALAQTRKKWSGAPVSTAP